MGFITTLYTVSNYFLWMNRLKKKSAMVLSSDKVFISIFSVEIVGGRENDTNVTEEVLKALYVVIEYYFSILCAHSEGPVERK